jgi:hypothetical protein
MHYLNRKHCRLKSKCTYPITPQDSACIGQTQIDISTLEWTLISLIQSLLSTLYCRLQLLALIIAIDLSVTRPRGNLLVQLGHQILRDQDGPPSTEATDLGVISFLYLAQC